MLYYNEHFDIRTMEIGSEFVAGQRSKERVVSIAVAFESCRPSINFNELCNKMSKLTYSRAPRSLNSKTWPRIQKFTVWVICVVLISRKLVLGNDAET